MTGTATQTREQPKVGEYGNTLYDRYNRWHKEILYQSQTKFNKFQKDSEARQNNSLNEDLPQYK